MVLLTTTVFSIHHHHDGSVYTCTVSAGVGAVSSFHVMVLSMQNPIWNNWNDGSFDLDHNVGDLGNHTVGGSKISCRSMGTDHMSAISTHSDAQCSVEFDSSHNTSGTQIDYVRLFWTYVLAILGIWNIFRPAGCGHWSLKIMPTFCLPHQCSARLQALTNKPIAMAGRGTG